MRRSGWRPGVIATSWAAKQVDAVLAAHDRPPAEGRVAVVGEDPIRVLLVGAGTAVGYGVRTRRQALDGKLADVLAERTGRGVIVESRIRADLRLGDTVELLGAAGAHTFSVAIWAPTFHEVLRLMPVRTWDAAVARIVAHLRSTGTVHVGLVLLGLPEVTPTTAAGSIALRRLRSVNGRIAAAAASAGAVFVPMPSVGTILGRTDLFGEEYYARCAALLAPAVLELLDPAAVPRS